MNTLTPGDIQVLRKGLELASLWIDEIPALVEDDFDPGTFERWGMDHHNFQELFNRLITPTSD